MFDFLNFFSSGATVFATGASLLNIYAQLMESKEKTKQALQEQRYLLRAQGETARFSGKQLAERTAEHSAICSYHVDMLRQEQLHSRQQLGYNILQSGIGITSSCSAGLLLRHTAYMDEMKARAVEAQGFYERPRSSFNAGLASLEKDAIRQKTSSIKAAAPWLQAGSVFQGLKELSLIGSLADNGKAAGASASANGGSESAPQPST